MGAYVHTTAPGSNREVSGGKHKSRGKHGDMELNRGNYETWDHRVRVGRKKGSRGGREGERISWTGCISVSNGAAADRYNNRPRRLVRSAARCSLRRRHNLSVKAGTQQYRRPPPDGRAAGAVLSLCSTGWPYYAACCLSRELAVGCRWATKNLSWLSVHPLWLPFQTPQRNIYYPVESGITGSSDTTQPYIQACTPKAALHFTNPPHPITSAHEEQVPSWTVRRILCFNGNPATVIRRRKIT